MRFLLLFISLLFLSKETLAQYEVRGKVVNETTPISYSSIKIFTSDKQLYQSTISDQTGNFILSIKDNGNYTLEISHIGYEPYSKSLAINQNIYLETIILQQSIEQIGEVVVKSKLPTIKRLSDRFIINSNESPILKNKSVDEIINMSPGVHIEHNGDISINGISGVRIMMNERLVQLSSEDLIYYLKGIHSSDIKNIEIISKPPAEFDAEGIGGIIKVNLAKVRKDGLSGYVGSQYKQGKYPKFNSTIGLNYKVNKWLFYGSYNSNYNKEFYDRFSERAYDQSTVSYTNDEHYTSNKDFYNYRIGIDYDLHKNHFIGFEFSGNNNNSKSSQASIYTQILNQNNLDSIVVGNYPTSGKNDSYNLNFNYIWSIDSLGRKLKFITDYSTFNREDFTLYENDYFDNNQIFSRSHNRQSTIEDDIKIYTAKLDYIHPFNQKTTLESGIKFSDVTTQNNNLFETFSQINNQFEIDLDQTNLYEYDENIYAGYIKLSSKWKKWDYNIGLRVEQTETKNRSVTQNTTITNSYFELFPSLFVKRILNEEKKNSLMFYYGRRIGRPDYIIMNPFEFYQDEFTIKRGNPNLQPQFTNAFELTYGLHDKHFFSLNYHYTENQIGDVEYREDDLTIVSFENVSKQHFIYFNAYTSFNPFPWWMNINNVNLFYRKFEGQDLNQEALGTFIDLKNYFQLSKTTSFEISSKFQTKGADRFYKDDWNYFDLSLGLSQRLFDSKAQLNLGADNIFNTWRTNGKISTDYQGQQNTIRYNRDTQLFYIGFKYFFKSGNSFRKTNKEKSNETEKERQR